MNNYAFTQCLGAIRHCRDITLVPAVEPQTGQDSLGALMSPTGDWHPDTSMFSVLAHQLGQEKAIEMLTQESLRRFKRAPNVLAIPV